jgi:hypothetical protein
MPLPAPHVPVSPALQRAVEELTPTSVAEVVHAPLRYSSEADALKTLAMFLDEPETAESVVLVRADTPLVAAVLSPTAALCSRPLTLRPSFCRAVVDKPHGS